MKIGIWLFGAQHDINTVQMCLRAIVVFVVTLIMIRISGRRSFGQRSPFDSVVTILLGATLSRAIVGASPFFATIIASFVIVMLHRALAFACLRFPWIARLVDGHTRQLFSNGLFNRREMNAALVSESDIREAVRTSINEDSLERVDVAVLERNGTVSILRKEKSATP